MAVRVSINDNKGHVARSPCRMLQQQKGKRKRRKRKS